MTSVTIKAFPSTEIHTVAAWLVAVPGTDSFWDVVAETLTRFPSLDASGISAYTYIVPGFTSQAMNITTPVQAFHGLFILPSLHPQNASDSLTTTIKQLFADAASSYPHQFLTHTESTTYPDFWALYQVINGPRDGGDDKILGSRLLDAKALTANLTSLAEAYRKATTTDSEIGVFLVSGKGVHNAKPRGGSNAVNPAWRTAYVHSGTRSRNGKKDITNFGFSVRIDMATIWWKKEIQTGR
jgi:hypothetical protein